MHKFQSTFPHGERLLHFRLPFPFLCFNPRSRTGNDGKCIPLQLPGRCFNPRSRTGNDKITAPIITLRQGFQSTFPHGERRYPVLCRPVRKEVSIHVPARGTTVHGEDLHAALSVSIHVPARGTTCLHRRFYNLQIVSIHVPARGTTELCQFTESNTRNVSLHVPARGTTIVLLLFLIIH